MQVEIRAIGTVRPYEKNPRVNDKAVDAVAASLRQFGWRQAIVVDAEGVIIAGHTRLLAARKLGMTEVPVHVATDLTPAQVKAYRIADNKVSELAEWDLPLLSLELADLQGTGFSLDELGFDSGELEKILGTEIPGEDTVPEVPAVAVTRPGDLWVLGEHRVLCGDATRPEDLERLLGGRKADMAFTDPPWNVAIGLDSNPRHRQRPGLANDDLSQADFSRFLEKITAGIAAHCVGDLYCVMGCQQWPVIDQALRQAGFHWSATVVWAKDAFVLGRSHYHRQYEPIWFGWPEGSASTFRGGRDQSDLWEIPRPRRSEEHPTMKPVALVARAIGNSSVPGATVLDPFLGSGTTVMACEELDRRCAGLELEPRYVDVAVTRWAKATGKEPMLVREGKEIPWAEVSVGFATAGGAGGASSASGALMTPATSASVAGEGPHAS